MSVIEKGVLDVRNMDIMARDSSWIHRLDPRSKLITTLVFILAVVSVDRYAIVQLLPFLIFPVALIAAGGLPPGYFLKKILLVSPFAVMIGMFNPLLDRTVILHLGSMEITGGWVSFLSLLIRFGLTVGAALILIALTSFSGICLALEKLKVPTVFVVQLQFLYRYIFVLMEEAQRTIRAHALRRFDRRAPSMKTFASMIGCLLLKATDRAERIHLAMRCRGFDGQVRMLTDSRFHARDLLFVIGWCGLFLSFRLYDIPRLLGQGVLEMIR